MIRGTPKFDGIAVGEIHVNFARPTIDMRVKAAFVDSVTGATCGWTEGTQWQPETIRKLDELRVCIERDLASIHFAGEAGSPVKPPAAAPRGLGGGLGEHLDGSGDAPTI